MKIEMTIREAMKVQAEQLDYYSRNLAAEAEGKMRATIRAKTKPPADEGRAWDTPMPVGEINEMVPRGADIEAAAGYGDSGRN